MGQSELFDADEFRLWRDEWKDMPEFVQEDLSPFKSLTVHFATLDDLKAFGKLIEQKITTDTRSIWFPPAEIGRYANKRYVDGNI